MKSKKNALSTPKAKPQPKRLPQPQKVVLRVFSTIADEKTRNLVLEGSGFAGATFKVGKAQLKPLQVSTHNVLLSGREIDAAGGGPLRIRARDGRIVTVDLTPKFNRPNVWYRFSGPDGHWFAPTGLSQPMLVLQVVFLDVTADWSGPDGAAHLGQLLNGPGCCANNFWQEASYGKTSFRFDIDPSIITLPGKLADYLIPIPNSSMYWFDTVRMIEDALTARVQSMSDADAESFLNSYMGVMISHAVNKDESNITGSEVVYWPHSDCHEVFYVRGIQYGMGYVCSTHAWGQTDYLGSWPVFTHELGHVLGLPDLYPSQNIPDTYEGQEVMQWDIMCNGQGDANPTAWEKAYRTTVPTDPGTAPSEPWMTQDDIVSLDPPGPGQTNSAEALLVPSSLELPPTNPFTASHPGVPLAHAVCLHLDPNRHILVEARQLGPIVAAPPFGASDYDQSIPCDGVIITEAVDNLDLFPATRRNVTLLSPDFSHGLPSWEQVTIGGGTITSWEDTAKRTKVELLEVVQTNPKVFHIKASWGPGPASNLYIAPWSPPPWESPDIWADDEANGWDVYTHSDVNLNPSVPGYPVGNGDALAVGSHCRLYARVHNIGDHDAQNVKVDFAIVLPPGVGSDIAIGSTIIPSIPSGTAALAMVEWTPGSSNGGHVCVQARAAVQPDELISVDNVAQENLTDWYVKKSSPYVPVEFRFQICNSLPEARLFEVEVIGLRKGFHVDVQPRYCWLEPAETRIGRARCVVADSVPLEDSERKAPIVHLQFKIFSGHEIDRIGGISGWVHCVRKASPKISVVPVGGDKAKAQSEGAPTTTARTGPGAEVRASYAMSAGPVAGAQVAVRLERPNGKTVTVERGVTDRNGRVKIWLDAPRGFSPKDEYSAVVMLVPMIGIGPETTVCKFHFTR